MFLPNPGILAAGAQGRTYDEWLAHITSRQSMMLTDGQLVSSAGGSGRRLVRVAFTDAGANFAMVGTTFAASPYRAQAVPDSTNFRAAILHGLPSVTIYNDVKQNSRSVLIDLAITDETGETLVPSLSRNGFTSFGTNFYSGDPYCFIGDRQGAGTSVGVSYWDNSTGKPMSYFPRAALFGESPGPFDYAAAGW